MDVCILISLIKNEKKMFMFWMEVLAQIFWRQNPMRSWTNPMSKCEKQSVLFILAHKYAQSHQKKKKNLWFAQWNVELNCVMLNMHTHKKCHKESLQGFDELDIHYGDWWLKVQMNPHCWYTTILWLWNDNK